MSLWQITKSQVCISWSTHECGSVLRKETLRALALPLPWEHSKKIEVREWTFVDLSRHLTWHPDFVFPVFLCWKLMWLFIMTDNPCWVPEVEVCVCHAPSANTCVPCTIRAPSAKWFVMTCRWQFYESRHQCPQGPVGVGQFLISSSTPSRSCPAKVEDAISL